MRQVEFACPSCSQQLTAPGDELGRPLRCARCDTSFKPLDVIALDVPLPALASAAAPEASPPQAARGGTIRIEKGASPGPAKKVAKGTVRMDQSALPAATRQPLRTSALSKIVDEIAERWEDLRRAVRGRVDPRIWQAAVVVVPTLIVIVVGCVALYSSVAGPAAAPQDVPAEAGSAATEGPVVTPAGLVLPSSLFPDRAGSGTQASGSNDGIDRGGKEGVGPGNLYLPASFHTKAGAFDVIVHAHGSPTVVVRSVELAGLDAAVVVMNMKKGSKYHEHFQDPAAFGALLDQVRKQVERRGVSEARIGRVALTSFSSGSGSVVSILNAASSELVDAVLVLDGLQVRWANDRPGRVDPHEISPLLKFARAAQRGDKLLVITHSGSASEDQANAGAVADVLLSELGAERKPMTEAPAAVEIDGAGGLFHDGKVIQLDPGTTATAGGVHVRGYGNKAPGHQPAHLVQMSRTALPLLAARWRSR